MTNFNLEPLSKLTSDAQPIWGKMTPQHMIEHLVLAVKLSNGSETINECMTPEDRLPLMKKILMSTRPLPKNFVNTVVGEGLKPLVYDSLEQAKESLQSELEQFENYFKENPSSVLNNPTFGPLNYEEWAQFHRKHLTHHFSQFGLTEE
jgi:hypothetical protein